MSNANQGSEEWLYERIGMITGSNIHRLMTNGKVKGELSAGAITYCNELVDDMIAQHPREEVNNYAMQRGLELEPVARQKFIEKMEYLNPVNPLSVEEVGFIKHPDFEHFGCSLDGIVSDGGSLEIKCRGRSAHLDQLQGCGAKVEMQMNWGFFCCNLPHGWFVGYSDEFELSGTALIIHYQPRNEKLIEEMKSKAIQATEYMKERYKQRLEDIKNKSIKLKIGEF